MTVRPSLRRPPLLAAVTLIIAVVAAPVLAGCGQAVDPPSHAASTGAEGSPPAAPTGAIASPALATGAGPAATGLPSPTPSPGLAPTPTPMRGPLGGDLLIADRGNARLLIVAPDRQIVWSMQMAPAGAGAISMGADDAFFTPDGRHIIVNEESRDVVALIDIATKRIVWQYGHPGVAGRGPGYLNTPDDAYQLPGGIISVADINNERILFIAPDGRVVRQYGLTGVRRHDPPFAYAAPNGDTPLPDGGTLVTEIGGSWVDRLDAHGHLVWSVHLPGIGYPSDAQLLPNGNVLVADYSFPGKIEEVTPAGRVVWRYDVTHGPGMLNHPSLAAQLPNGNLVVNDDFNDRVVVIDPKTDRIVWQYGHTGVAGMGPGYLNTPDGLNFMPSNVVLP